MSKKQISNIIRVIWIAIAVILALLMISTFVLCGLSVLEHDYFKYAISCGLFGIASWVLFVAFIAIWNGIRD